MMTLLPLWLTESWDIQKVAFHGVVAGGLVLVGYQIGSGQWQIGGRSQNVRVAKSYADAGDPVKK
jgi:hypothetical protein